jgi:hypothetical protein
VNSIYGSGKYLYAGVNCNGIYRRGANIITTINNTSENVISYKLFQNYPNPFNPTTTIKFDVVRSGDVKIIVYDVMGREIQTLVNEKLQPGTYKTSFDGSNLNSGIYFYQMVSGNFKQTRKLILLK